MWLAVRLEGMWLAVLVGFARDRVIYEHFSGAGAFLAIVDWDGDLW